MRISAQCIRKGKEPVPLQVYVSSALEVAMPTITMWILCQFGSPVSSLTSSLNYAYFLIIILSPLWRKRHAKDHYQIGP
jgi:hypothetical protein